MSDLNKADGMYRAFQYFPYYGLIESCLDTNICHLPIVCFFCSTKRRVKNNVYLHNQRDKFRNIWRNNISKLILMNISFKTIQIGLESLIILLRKYILFNYSSRT